MNSRPLSRLAALLRLPVLRAVLIGGAALLGGVPTSGWSQSPAAAESPAAETERGDSPPPLATRQDALALRYKRFEDTLQQLKEYLRKSDPDRADLLERALSESKQTLIPDQLGELTLLLEREQLGDAISGQEAVIQQMKRILQLLQSEDRQSELEKEQ
ncbi:MAG: hypothetical protein SFV23_26425, partial [Planctomycetaceae bacterium]|nr:hypothetical protein [Planctomycetaceae bacterium]